MSNSEIIKQSIKLSLVVAMNESNRGIGVNGTLPWRLPKDMKHFSRVTTFTNDLQKKNALIMGKRTWMSLPKSLRPLPNRLNVIISTTLTPETCEANEKAQAGDFLIFSSFGEAIDTLLKDDYAAAIENIYAIGGSLIYKSALAYSSPLLYRIYLTRVFSDVECDTFMEPENFLDTFQKAEEINDKENFNVEFNVLYKEADNLEYCFEIYEKIQN